MPTSAKPASRLVHRRLRGSPPPVAVGGRGVWLHAADGMEILDAEGGAAISCLGHQHPRVVAAIQGQAERLAYAHTGFFSSEPAEALAEVLVDHEPGGLAYAYFVSGGSEAVEATVRMARQYFREIAQPERTRFIARRQSYNGNTLGALSAGGNAWRRAPYAPLLSLAFSHVTPAFAYREQLQSEAECDFTTRWATELEAEFQRLGPANVAAFLAEPVVGTTAGCVPAPPGYIKAVREVCDRHGARLILDEVCAAWAAAGTLHAWEQEGIAPDVQAVAKGLGGGYQPIGAVLAAARVIKALHDGSGSFQHGHTYLAHSVACAAVLAVQLQQVIHKDGPLAQVQAQWKCLEQRLTERLGNHRNVGAIRGRGLFRGIELVAHCSSKAAFDPALRLHDRVKAAAFARGLACYTAGGTVERVRGDHVLSAPPHIITSAEIDLAVERLGDAIDDAIATVGAL